MADSMPQSFIESGFTTKTEYEQWLMSVNMLSNLDTHGQEYAKVHGVQEKLAEAVANVIECKPDDPIVAIANFLSPPSPSPIDTRSAAAFNNCLAATGTASLHLNLIGLGDELGYFQSLLVQPKGYAALAKDTGCIPRYTKEWCIAMAAGTILVYDEIKQEFAVNPTITSCFVPTMNQAGLIWATLIPAATDKRATFAEVYKTGKGIDWNDRDKRLCDATTNFFKPLYEGLLVRAIPADIKAKLIQGGALADVGCGQGLSTILMAKEFPQSTFVGFDYSAWSIEVAAMAAKEAGITNASFVCIDAEHFGSKSNEFDFACFLDCFHDMSVASKVAKRAGVVIKEGGAVFLIEPPGAENDSIKEQLALPTTALFGAISAQVCLCCSMCNDGDGLGALCPTAKHRELFLAGGFQSLDAIESPVNAAGFRFLVAKK